jgi:hypothetical protein
MLAAMQLAGLTAGIAALVARRATRTHRDKAGQVPA